MRHDGRKRHQSKSILVDNQKQFLASEALDILDVSRSSQLQQRSYLSSPKLSSLLGRISKKIEVHQPTLFNEPAKLSGVHSIHKSPTSMLLQGDINSVKITCQQSKDSMFQ